MSVQAEEERPVFVPDHPSSHEYRKPTSAQNRTERGLVTMDAVYGTGPAAAMPTDRTPALAVTIDHLFGEIGSRPGLSIDWGNGTAVQSGIAAALANRHVGYAPGAGGHDDATH